MSEATIQRAICDALEKMGIRYLRLNSGKTKVRGGYVQLCPNGTADLMLLQDGGKPLFLEVKKPDGKQSPDQVKFQSDVEALGYRYALIRAVEELSLIVDSNA